MPQPSVDFDVIAGFEPAIQPLVTPAGNKGRGLSGPTRALGRALRVGCLLAAALALAACGRCGAFLSLSQDGIAACHSDTPPQ